MPWDYIINKQLPPPKKIPTAIYYINDSGTYLLNRLFKLFTCFNNNFFASSGAISKKSLPLPACSNLYTSSFQFTKISRSL